MIEGIIDAYHGDDVDLPAFKAGGGLAVLLKASEGRSFIDPKFVRRLVQARDLGLLVGAYHFCTADPTASQVDLFLSLAGGIPELRLAIDLEPNGSNTVTIRQGADIATRIQKATGQFPIAYLGRYGPAGDESGLPNKVLSQCDLWISHYTTKAAPTLPKGWLTYRIWQYTEDKPIDLNRFNGTEAELRAWWGA